MPVLVLLGLWIAQQAKVDLPAPGRLRVGLEYEETLQRRLEDGELVRQDVPIEVKRADLRSHAAFVSLSGRILGGTDEGFSMEAYGLVGARGFGFRGVLVTYYPPNEAFGMDARADLALGFGVRCGLYSAAKVSLHSDFRMAGSRSDANIDQIAGLLLDVLPGESADQEFKMSVLTWELSACATLHERAILPLRPYAGVRLSGVRFDLNGHQEVRGTPDREISITYAPRQNNIFGVMAGANVVLGGHATAFVEMHALNEFGLRFGVGWTF